MEQPTHQYQLLSFLKSGKKEHWLIILVAFIGLAIFQDFLFSQFQDTGFYLSESLLYNSIWIFLFPLVWLELRLVKRVAAKSKMTRVLAVLGMSILFSLLHILIFALFFVSVSYFVFFPTHRFTAIFNTALSNQLYIIFGFYAVAPLLYARVRHQSMVSAAKYPAKIKVKKGTEIVVIATNDIQLISTDKPYSVVYVHHKRYFDSRTLKDFEDLLNPEFFLRVHRSSMVNTAYVKALTSRQNGDYDALLENGQTVRLSRHYRENWQQLLH